MLQAPPPQKRSQVEPPPPPKKKKILHFLPLFWLEMPYILTGNMIFVFRNVLFQELSLLKI